MECDKKQGYWNDRTHVGEGKWWVNTLKENKCLDCWDKEKKTYCYNCDYYCKFCGYTPASKLEIQSPRMEYDESGGMVHKPRFCNCDLTKPKEGFKHICYCFRCKSCDKVIRKGNKIDDEERRLCHGCSLRIKDELKENQDHFPKPNEPRRDKPTTYIPVGNHHCEKCGVDCFDGRQTKFWIITHYYTNFNKKVWCFGINCSCAEQFKRENQQTCGQCQKREWPDMEKGWLLDYEVHKAFCSPICHVAYREALWTEQNQNRQNIPDYSQWAKQSQLFPQQLELTNSNNQSNFDWEKEALKKEVLTLREYTKELEKKLVENQTSQDGTNNQVSQNNPNNKTSQSAINKYLRTLTQNTLQKAEQSYQDKYGEAELDTLSSLGQGEQPKKNYWPLIIGIGLVGGGLIIGLVVWLTTRNKKGDKAI